MRRSAIRTALKSQIEALDVSSYSQTGVASLWETKTGDVVQPGAKLPHLAYKLDFGQSRPIERGVGDDMLSTQLSLFVHYVLRPGIEREGDIALAADLAEDLAATMLQVQTGFETQLNAFSISGPDADFTSVVAEVDLQLTHDMGA